MSELKDILDAGQCPECKRLTARNERLETANLRCASLDLLERIAKLEGDLLDAKEEYKQRQEWAAEQAMAVIKGLKERIAELEATLERIQIDSDEIIIVAAQTISKYARQALAKEVLET